MSRVKIKYETENAWLEGRKKFITSTEIPALFGITKYGNTLYKLWNVKAGKIEDDFKTNERIEIGKFFERPIAEYAAKVNDWEITDKSGFELYHSVGPEKLASSYDFICRDKDGTFVNEIKNVDALSTLKSGLTKRPHYI